MIGRFFDTLPAFARGSGGPGVAALLCRGLQRLSADKLDALASSGALSGCCRELSLGVRSSSQFSQHCAWRGVSQRELSH